MATSMHAFLGARIPGSPAALPMVTRGRKPRFAWATQWQIDNSIGMSARWHRRP